MKFEKVDYIPCAKQTSMRVENPTRRMLYGFVNSEITMARVIWSPSEYKSPTIMYQCIRAMIKKYFARYNINVCMRKDEVYLVKGDLNELL